MVHHGGLSVVKGVHSLGWEGVWKRTGGNQDYYRKILWVVRLS
jgi:hypothetical protein